MVEEAKKLGLPEPELLEIGMRVRCIVRFAEEFGASVPEPPRAESGLESGLESALLNELRDGPLSRSEIAQRLGHKRISGVVNRLIRRLMISGRIVQTLPEKPNSRLQKYRKV
jgi:ATP-dependent DNA helicase RecG